jgi:ribonuclease-3
MTDLERRIGYGFESPGLLEEAMCHGSVSGSGEPKASYQRLEFLGDAVLNLCIADELYRRLPVADEGTLSKARSAVINNRSLVRVGERIGVPEYLRIDPSVREKGGGVTRRMIADAVEALTGAIFVDGGYPKAREFVLVHFWEESRIMELIKGFDAKSVLQEWCQRRHRPLPRYVLREVSGPPHSLVFTVTVRSEEGPEAVGSGRTKKEAEMDAAARLLELLPPNGTS